MPANITPERIAGLPLRYRLEQGPLILYLLPSLLRQARQVAWLKALLTPLLSLQLRFADLVRASLTELSYNGQTLQLQRALNDRFDHAFRRILIINSDTENEPSYDNFLSELEPPAFLSFYAEGPPYLYDYSWQEILSQVGFTVKVPRGLSPLELPLQARIRQLKLTMIKHTLIYF